MKFLRGISCLCMIFSLTGYVSPPDKDTYPDSFFNNDTTNVEFKVSRNYTIGNIDLRYDDQNEAYSSALQVILKSSYRNPICYLTMSYEGDNNEILYWYRNYNLTRYYNSRVKTFYFNLNCPVKEMKADSKIELTIDYRSKRDITSVNFNLANPIKPRKIFLTPCKVYLRFAKLKEQNYGVSYFMNIMGARKQSYDGEIFYYDSYDVFNKLALRAPIRYGVMEAKLLIDNKNLDVFNDVTYVSNFLGKDYRTFNLISLQRRSDYYTDFKIDGTYYFDPTSNLMSSTKKEGFIESKDKIYMPLKHYEEFKTFNMIYWFKFKINAIVYEIYMPYFVDYARNYLKDEILITKTNEKVVEDSPTMEFEK